ncbi:ABC transporter ATP-binding protein [Sporomusa termitida]|uniref:Taurine import ATP-binding protein TauB n=1 Tax=Sporomusa termitida TaxID=2377 RepID=A0A517DYJ3_9FIRM|nr:ABC transporter ATP-binding protein [Sporomusa termitida]QDR82437.1 Taurine import ATP-binding protein TauB [Sporomusa termitida]
MPGNEQSLLQRTTDFPAGQPVIQLAGISLRYSQSAAHIQALADINLELSGDDFVCVLGPSGCGKSSLLNIIAGFLQPTTGTITVDGNIHSKPDPQVGVVFQHPNLFPWLSIEKNIEFGLKMKQVGKEQRKELVAHYLQLVGLDGFAKLLPFQLSGGMKQRAAIARTLATDPRMILLDEPFSALDAFTRETMQKNLYDIWHKTRKCLLFITHDVDEALLLAKRIIIMQPNPGRIVNDFPNPLLRRPEQAFSRLRSAKEFNDMRQFLIGQIHS